MPTRDEVIAATQRWLLSRDNTPGEVDAWSALYSLIHTRPPGSRNATHEDESPVILP